MNLTTIEYEKQEHIAYVTLNRPEKLNAMNADMHRELGEVWDDFQQDPEMRAAILSGKGRCSKSILTVTSAGAMGCRPSGVGDKQARQMVTNNKARPNRMFVFMLRP